MPWTFLTRLEMTPLVAAEMSRYLVCSEVTGQRVSTLGDTENATYDLNCGRTPPR